MFLLTGPCSLAAPQFSSVQSLSHVRLFATPWQHLELVKNAGSQPAPDPASELALEQDPLDYQADEQAGVAQLSWRLSSR